MIRVLWILLLVASSVLWARDIDESVIDANSLRLDDVICKGCQKMRSGSTDSTSCEMTPMIGMIGRVMRFIFAKIRFVISIFGIFNLMAVQINPCSMFLNTNFV